MAVVRRAVPHSILLIGDRQALPPVTFGGASVVATDAVVALAVVAEVDGEVIVRVASAEEVEALPAGCAYSGTLALQSGAVSVCTSEDEVLLEVPVAGTTAAVAIWTNHADSPDEVVVSVG